MDEYAAAKRVLFQRQQPGDLAVINTHDAAAGGMGEDAYAGDCCR